MKRVLRSLISVDNVPGQEYLRANYYIFLDSKLEFLTDQDSDIYKYIRDFFNESKEGELPGYHSVFDYFENDGRPDVMDRLKEVRETNRYTKADFEKLCRDLYAEQQVRKLDNLIRETSTIKSTGMKDGPGKHAKLKKGVRHAVEHFISKADELLTVDAKGKLKGNVLDDGQEVLSEYESQVGKKQSGRGIGLTRLDFATGGLRPGELMLILGYVGELKSTLALNYAYNTAVYYGWNVFYLSLEMKYEQVRRILYCMHSTHPKFQRFPGDSRHIEYSKLRDGLLSPEESELLHAVATDFDEGQKIPDGEVGHYGKIIIERPVGDITVPGIKLKAEVEHRKSPLGLLIADHAGLIEGEGGRSVNNYGVSLNYVLKDLSQLALNFNDGEGIPVCTPFQANRQGWKDACKNEGRYKLDALSWANEAERSASVILYTFLGDNDTLRKDKQVLIGCLKNRDGDLPPQFRASIEFVTRRIRNLETGIDTAGGTVEDLGFGDDI